MRAERFDWTQWSDLLAEVVTPQGRVEYSRLSDRRDRLEAVVAGLAAASPERTPEQFPTAEDALAYWLNAYNVFTLHAIIAEYPIATQAVPVAGWEESS